MSAESMISLPPKIDKSLTKILGKVDAEKWVRSAVSLSQKYRRNRNQEVDYFEENDDIFIEEVNDVLGYLALRSPATYAQLYSAMCNVKEIHPSWKPISILDIGSGPGTAIWSAREVWPSIKKVTCLERDSNFSEIGTDILKSYLPKSVIVDWKTADLSLSKPEIDTKYDLVTLGNVLNEMRYDARKDILEFAYQHCQGVLLVVEPGTPYGFDAVKQASIQLDSYEGTLVAPYIDNSLVLPSSEWIVFAQKIKRTEYHRRIRQVQRRMDNSKRNRVLPASDWEEVKYTYVAQSKIKPEVSPWARIIADPESYKPYVELKILTKDGIRVERVLKRDKPHFKFAKRLKWGEVINSPEDI